MCSIYVHADPDDYFFTEQVLVFTSTDTVFNVMITLIDDNIYESPEDFVVELEMVDVETNGTLIDPARATVTITDDDGMF